MSADFGRRIKQHSQVIIWPCCSLTPSTTTTFFYVLILRIKCKFVSMCITVLLSTCGPHSISLPITFSTTTATIINLKTMSLFNQHSLSGQHTIVQLATLLSQTALPMRCIALLNMSPSSLVTKEKMCVHLCVNTKEVAW